MTAAPRLILRSFAGRHALSTALPAGPALAVSMLCLCLYVPVVGEAQAEFQYFESKGLPSELKSIFKLSVFIPSQEFSTFRQWKQVCRGAGGMQGRERQRPVIRVG